MLVSRRLKQIDKIWSAERHRQSPSSLLNFGKSNLNIFGSSQSYVSQGFNSNVCWKCGLERKNPAEVFCDKCSTIQNPQETTNYFRILDVDERFDIDMKELRNKYRKLQSYLHPDKFSNKSEEEQAISANFSSLVNKAFNSLQRPLQRAEHLLQLKGTKLNKEEEEEQQQPERTVDDPEFLMEMMELNEELENAIDAEHLKKLDIKNKNRLEIIAREIDECFKKSDLKEAKNLVIKMKYYSSLGNRINKQLRELGIVD